MPVELMCARPRGKARRSTWSSLWRERRSMHKGSILVVDDEAEIREGIEMLLSSEGYGVASAETGDAGLAKLEEQPFDLLLLDVSLPDRNGLELLREIRRRDPFLSVVLITAYGSIDMARAAFKNGAQDYITKPWSNDELLIQVAQAVEGRRLREENVQLKRALKERYNFPNIIGKSDRIRAGLDLVSQVASSRSTVLRWIQEREFMRLGGPDTIKVDVRLIAASNVQLLNLVREGRFREDLYHRLNVIAIPLPPLRERKEDIPLLLSHFLRRFAEEN